MNGGHDNVSRSKRVSEPVQVYLSSAEAAQLERLTRRLSASKSDVIRRGLSALEQQLTDPTAHPAFRVIGLVEREFPDAAEGDGGRDHDRLLTDAEVASWRRPPENA